MGILVGISLMLTPFEDAISAAQERWLEIRAMDAHQLTQLADPAFTQNSEQRIPARLTLAERALNESIAVASTHLQQADVEISPGSDNALFALALRCQLEHRQGLDGAAQTCSPLNTDQTQSDNQVIQSFIHVTLAYFFYREGDHERSLDEANKALVLAEQINDHGLLANANNLVGLHFNTRRLPRLSMAHLESAWEHAGQLPNPEFKVLIQLNLASNYTYLGRGQEALEMLMEVKDLPVVSIYPTRRLVLQSMIAQAEVRSGNLDNTEQELLAVMAEVSDKVLPDGMTFAYTGLGLVQLAEGRADEALQSFDEVLKITGQNFDTGLAHPRLQLLVVDYARALRQSGQIQAAQQLLQSTVDYIPSDQPDQLMVDAYAEMALTLEASGDRAGSADARATAARLEQGLWDASFQYQMARLNASMQSDRARLELERAQERENALQEKAEREKTLRLQSLLIGAMLVAVILLFQSRRMQKKVADSERAASEGLEDLVKTRTQELEDEMAERLKVEVDRRGLMEKLSEREKLHALGQLTAGVAHDFNNLMTVVSLSADHLKSDRSRAQDTPDSELLDNILSAADTGSKITNGLLAYVRKQPLQPIVLQLDEYLQKSLPLFSNTLGERFELKTQLEACVVRVDQGQLTTSLLNLILNAREAMQNHGQLELILRRNNGRAEIMIRDSGMGMSADVCRRVFEPFYTTKDSGEGTGLGLSMVYGFARQSGGDICINSELGRGTTVTLMLPMVGSELNDELAPPAESSSKISRGVDVLVVEDRELLRRMLDRTLTKLGMNVSVAKNADDALALVKSNGMPDLLVSDIVMPGRMDGPKLAEELRLRDPDLAVLLISGYSDSVDESCRFLRKPFSMSDLEQAVAAAINDVNDRPDDPG